MRLLVTIVILMMTFHTQMWSQETWVKTFGGSENDHGSSIITTPDGGYVLTGWTSSNDGDFKGIGKGDEGIFVIRLNEDGEVLWKRCFGESDLQSATSITATHDGGYALTGTTSSNNDIFVIRLNEDGDSLWRKNYGGGSGEIGQSIRTTPDGGFILTGDTYSKDGDFKGMNQGLADVFVIKLDADGDVEWKRTFGGEEIDFGSSITTTSDGGFVLTGVTASYTGDFTGMNKDSSCIFMIKLNEGGDIVWKTCFGGSRNEEGRDITTTADGGYVVTGNTNSNDGDFQGMNNGGEDIFVIKLDAHGDIEWKRTLGGSSDESGSSIKTTPDGGYVVTGTTNSNDGNFYLMEYGRTDIFVIKLDTHGDTEWKRLFGGSKEEAGSEIATTTDGGYVLTGSTNSNHGDFKGMNSADSDIFLIKLDSEGKLQRNNK